MIRIQVKKRTLIWGPLVVLLVVGSILGTAIPLMAGGQTKVVICNIPPGNPDNPQTIEVSEKAVQTHLDRHGNLEGACGGSGGGSGDTGAFVACNIDSDCVDGLVCSTNLFHPTPVCLGAEGTACIETDFCASGFLCNGTCGTGASAGDTCSVGADCATPDFSLFCNSDNLCELVP